MDSTHVTAESSFLDNSNNYNVAKKISDDQDEGFVNEIPGGFDDIDSID